ncbi:PPK2 family polyphosphate kinase [Aestuariimicrobium kwangyangense]|uniref:PPK2 family polyphosphate kinase n=1 Tax=Aestuariimicrobium kwangyangense TaxID=396389 RepID=UPI0003B46473|nr:PPK2 family polyphosphate kinase [Aestuariimicrobium kwangyangense]
MATKNAEPINAELNLTDLLRVPAGALNLDDVDPRGRLGYPGRGKRDSAAHMAIIDPELSDLQERLYAASRVDEAPPRSLLLVLQGLDTSGKGGVIRKAIGMVDPQGVQLKAFKAPTDEEKSHPFLWRIKKALPTSGMIGIFDRSHYEDVLVTRVNGWIDKATWEARYDEINSFEADLAASGTTVLKCWLHVSWDEQYERLAERLENPDKHWKYNPGDLDTRRHFAEFQTAASEAISRTNTDVAPWYVVPADRKWYRNWAVAQLLLEHLRAFNLGWPVGEFSAAEQLEELAKLR